MVEEHSVSKREICPLSLYQLFALEWIKHEEINLLLNGSDVNGFTMVPSKLVKRIDHFRFIPFLY